VTGVEDCVCCIWSVDRVGRWIRQSYAGTGQTFTCIFMLDEADDI
jgi:hypothetical protein